MNQNVERVLCQNSDSHGIPKRRPTGLDPFANTDTKLLLIDGLFQKSRVLAQDGFMVASLRAVLVLFLRNFRASPVL